MPEVSPRRSSRARVVPPPPNPLTHNNSSSSASSGKADRTNKAIVAPQERSATSPSNHSDETEHLDQGTRQTRRQKREQEAALDPKAESNEEQDDEEENEEDVTRCICGKLEYPGPPRPNGDRRDTVELQDPDAGGLFIQCDVCHVWQHGGCVGIMDEAATPDNYYCEQCKPSYHKIMTGGRAHKYSRYMPVPEARPSDQNRKRVTTKEPESRSSKESDGRNNANNASGKRRSTMNSRAMYEEEEVFRRVLEESKGNNGGDETILVNRKGKRTRDESDDSARSEHELKRRKTGSGSPPDSSTVAADIDSDDEATGSRNKGSLVRPRSNKTQIELEREFRRRGKEREQERQAAANRRKGRADRRRGDELDVPQEPVKPTTSSKVPIAPQMKSSKNQSLPRQPNVSPSHSPALPAKKNARPTRRNKVGRNQYTRDRDAAADARAEAARNILSRDGEVAGSETFTHLLPNGSRPAKPKHMNPMRTSMNELRKRAAGILEYISRTQVEMAGERTPSGSQTPSKSLSRPPISKPLPTNGTSKLSNEVQDGSNAGEGKDGWNGEEGTNESKVAAESFKEMNTLQMMDVLTREIVHWQQQHGKWGSRGDG